MFASETALDAFHYLLDEGEMPPADEVGCDIETDADLFLEDMWRCLTPMGDRARQQIAVMYGADPDRLKTYGDAARVMSGWCLDDVED